MANFVGRANDLLLFTEGDRGVIVDAQYGLVVASGQAELLELGHKWADGEYSDLEASLAASALSLQASITPGSRRGYTIPRGVQVEAKRALEWFGQHKTGASPLGLKTAALLASGGQVGLEELTQIARHQQRLSTERADDSWEPRAAGVPAPRRISWGLWGGDAGQRWSTAIVERSITAALEAPPVNPFLDAYELDENAAPEFLARVRMDGSGIDRLYKIDYNGAVYLWDDAGWDDMGTVQTDIWTIDRALDTTQDTVEKTHIVIDPDSAVIIGARLTVDPFTFVSIEDLDADEARMVLDAEDEDWGVIDYTLTAAGEQADATPDATPNVYTEEERAANAQRQVRDKNGKFAKVGSRVMVNGNPAQTGNITRVNPANGSVDVLLENGQSVNVDGKAVEGVGQYTTTIPGQPVEVPDVDTSGILGEPRVPINKPLARIPGTLPAMGTKDLHALIYNFPAWVAGQRDAFKAAGGSKGVAVQGKNSTNLGKSGRALENETGKKLLTDAYQHPLISQWLKKTENGSVYPNELWYEPITSAGAPATPDPATPAPATAPAGGDKPTEKPAETAAPVSNEPQEMTPDESDVTPIYMAVVAPDDPRAVLALISLVPKDTQSNSPMTYKRMDGEWVRDPKTLQDLNSATPPPVVPLDSDTLNTVLSEVDNVQESGISASAWIPMDLALMIHWGSPYAPTVVDRLAELAQSTSTPDRVRLDASKAILDLSGAYAVTAAGGLDRNRGGAEKLRRYWTIGKGGAKIRWGTGGDWTRCVRHLSKFLGARAKGYCALRHKEMTGQWTGDQAHREKFGRTASLSSDHILDFDAIGERALLAARLREARNRMSLTAAAPIERGANFIIPLVLPEGVETGDGRAFMPDTTDLRNLPLPLKWQPWSDKGHDKSYVVGTIQSMERVPGGIGNARGWFDTSEIAREAERMVRAGMWRWVSADTDQFSAETVVISTLAEGEEEDESDGKKIGQEKMLVDHSRVMGVTMVAMPAFQECLIFLDEDESLLEVDMLDDGIYMEDIDPLEAAALVAAGYVASAVPIEPPASWFENQHLTQATPLTVTDEGQVFGHIAAWHVDHIGMTAGTKPPRSRSNYGYFHTGVLRTEAGTDVPVGQLTLAGGHAGLEASAREAVKHYDDTASAIADVHAGEDGHGIWVAGSIRPGATPEQVRALRASAPSGDWRPIKGHLELVAVCQVNVPGFPIARARVAGGHVMALVAAGAATMAKLKADPLNEMQARLDSLEQFTRSELNNRAAPARAKLLAAKAEHEALVASALKARQEKTLETMRAAGYVPLKERPLSARVAAAKAALPSEEEESKPNPFAPAEETAPAPAPAPANGVADKAPEADSPKAPAASPTKAEAEALEVVSKYTAKTQPRDGQGRFRLILARLRDDLGTSGNQDVLEKLQQVENLDNVGDYTKATEASADLFNTIDRLDTGALNGDSLENIRKTTTDLGLTIANLPLPFSNQAQKVRFSDLPPALRTMIDTMVEKVKDKIGASEGAKATQEIRGFMSGSDVYSQSEVSSHLNKMLRLLT